MGLRKPKFNNQADWLNDRLCHFIKEDFDKTTFRHQERLLLKDERFVAAVYDARVNLDILDNPHSIEPSDERVAKEAIQILEKTHMPNGWFDYICEYVVNDGNVENAYVEPQLHIEIEDVIDEELILSIKKGITSKEYRAAWKALKVFLKENPTSYEVTEEGESEKVYFARRRGLGVSEIAKQFFPEEYKRDPIATRDRIKKIIVRYDSKK